MKITAVEACTCVVPLDAGVAIATRALTERHFTLVRVRTDTGADGIGFCYGGHRAGHLVTLAVRDLLRDVVVGRDAHQVEAIWDAMYHESLLHGRRGAVLRAISAVDIALWDAISMDAGLPLYRYLGGYREDWVPAYASGGYYAEGKGPDGLAREMQSYLDMGFRAVKMKVGRVPPSEDAVRVRTAREAVGADVPLFLDANNAWPDAATAIGAVRLFEEQEPGWIEEPLMPDDVQGHATICRCGAHSRRHRRDPRHLLGLSRPHTESSGLGFTARRRRLRRHNGVAQHRGDGIRAQPAGGAPLAGGPARAPGGLDAQRHLGRVLHRLQHHQLGKAVQNTAGGGSGRPGPP